MQKLITVSVNTQQLVKSTTDPFSINEVDSVNELLEQGWEIEQLELLNGASGDGEILFLVILNDDLMFDEEDDERDNSFGFDDDDDDDDLEDDLEDEDLDDRKGNLKKV